MTRNSVPTTVIYSARSSGTRYLERYIDSLSFPFGKMRVRIIHGSNRDMPLNEDGPIDSRFNMYWNDDVRATLLIVRSDPYWWRSMEAKDWLVQQQGDTGIDIDRQMHARSLHNILTLNDDAGWPMPLIVTYEALLTHPQAVLDEVRRHLGATSDDGYEPVIDGNEKYRSEP